MAGQKKLLSFLVLALLVTFAAAARFLDEDDNTFSATTTTSGSASTIGSGFGSGPFPGPLPASGSGSTGTGFGAGSGPAATGLGAGAGSIPSSVSGPLTTTGSGPLPVAGSVPLPVSGGPGPLPAAGSGAFPAGGSTTSSSLGAGAGSIPSSVSGPLTTTGSGPLPVAGSVPLPVSGGPGPLPAAGSGAFPAGGSTTSSSVGAGSALGGGGGSGVGGGAGPALGGGAGAGPGVGGGAGVGVGVGGGAGAGLGGGAGLEHPLVFYMHDILGGSNPTARAVTGVVANPALSGQLPFAKPNGANLPVSNGVPSDSNNIGLVNNNNVPFLVGLGGTTANILQNDGSNILNGLPVANGGQLPSGSALQMLMFGTMTVIDDELTEGHELGSGLLGKAQGYYIASAVDGTSQTMAFTAMFASGGYEDSISFFGVHRTAASESHIGIMGGTGRYVNARGFAIVKTFTGSNGSQQQQLLPHQFTDGLETVLEVTVYLSY